MRKTPPVVNPTTDRRTAKIRTKSLIRKSRNRTQRELSPSYPPSDGGSRIENGNLAAKCRRSAEKIGKHGLPQQKRILPPLPAHSGDPHRTLPAFSRKNKLLSGKEPSIPPLIPEEYKRLKGCRHNQQPDPSPHGGNASSESRIFAVHLSRLPIRRTADPIDSPPQLLPQPPQPALPASEVVRFSPNEGKRDYNVLFGNVTTRIPLRRKDLRESRHYRHGLRPRTTDRRMTDIEIYDCRGKSIFFRELDPNKRRIRP